MDYEQVLQLIDSCWFESRIFQTKHALPSLPHRKTDKSEGKAKISRSKNLQIRSYSERCLTVDLESDSPRSVIIKPRLQRIKEKREKPRVERRERGTRSRRSLSALEIEEVKGFMDLGFVFEEEETNKRLASIVQKRGEVAAAAGVVEVSKPYLSEAWSDCDLNWGREDGKVLMNWRSMKSEMDVKDHLKIWAHVVASKIR